MRALCLKVLTLRVQFAGSHFLKGIICLNGLGLRARLGGEGPLAMTLGSQVLLMATLEADARSQIPQQYFLLSLISARLFS
jgi:hypothetical protein